MCELDDNANLEEGEDLIDALAWCEWCGEPVHICTSNGRTYNRKFCSAGCKESWREHKKHGTVRGVTFEDELMRVLNGWDEQDF